jgi:phage baseplate assembly protein W
MSIDAGKVLGRGVAFPFRVGPNGRIAWSAGEKNIREDIMVILMTEPGERVMLSSFGAGLRSMLFEPNDPTTRSRIQGMIATALTQWEPRISLQSVSVEQDPNDLQSVIATITYTLVATQATQTAALSITLS